jgi:hypothetical protein
MVLRLLGCRRGRSTGNFRKHLGKPAGDHSNIYIDDHSSVRNILESPIAVLVIPGRVSMNLSRILARQIYS